MTRHTDAETFGGILVAGGILGMVVAYMATYNSLVLPLGFTVPLVTLLSALGIVAGAFVLLWER